MLRNYESGLWYWKSVAMHDRAVLFMGRSDILWCVCVCVCVCAVKQVGVVQWTVGRECAATHERAVLFMGGPRVVCVCVCAYVRYSVSGCGM